MRVGQIGPDDLIRTLSSVVEQTADTVIITDHNGNIEYVNPAFEAMTGYVAEEVIGKTPRILKSGKHDVGFYEELWRSILSGRVFRADYINKKKNGEEWVEKQTITPLRDSQGTIVHFVATGKDVTDSKKAHEQLQQSEEQFRSLFESARDAMFSLLTNGVIKSLNPAFETITGWERAEWLGKSFLELLHPEDRLPAERVFGEVIAGKRFTPQEYRIVTKSGGYLPTEFTTTPLLVEGKVVGILGIGRDVSERRKLEDQFHQAQKLEAIGSLVSGVAHDFNNILMVILGYTSFLLIKLPQDSPLRREVEEIVRAGKRAADLTHQLLAFSRKETLNPQRFDPSNAIRNLSKMLSRLIGDDITLRLELSTQSGFLLCDLTQFDQILINLVVNARDAMPAGGEIVLATAVTPEQEYRISVTDTGEGIPNEIIDRIFEPFFTTKPAGKGTGLGLAMVYGAVQQNKGRITVDSEPGRGTVMNIYFKKIAPGQTLSTSTPGAGEHFAAKDTILLVDDDESVRLATRSLLESLGFTVLDASSGGQALQVYAANQRRIDFVATDVRMPGMAGTELVRRLRELNTSVRVILFSGYMGDIEQVERDLGPGSTIIQKPFDGQTFLEKIRLLKTGSTGA